MLSKKSKFRRPRNFFIVFAGVLFLDQFLKNLFLARSAVQKNYAALFGLEISPVLLILLFIIFLSGISIFLKNHKDAARFAPIIALILAGIASNIIDKFHTGFIIDYIRLSDIFIFNLADLAIFLGVSLFIWRIIKE